MLKDALETEELQKIDLLAWHRTDIFPDFASSELGPLPEKHQASPAEALDALRKVAGRFRSLSLTVGVYAFDKDGKEVLDGREWQVLADVAARRFVSRRKGEDCFDVSDGGKLTRCFPLLKYAARRNVAESDLKALLAALPEYIAPWAEKLDREWLVSVEKKDGENIVLRLSRRGAENSYTLLHLAGTAGPVTRVEVYEPADEDGRAVARLVQTAEVLEFVEAGGVRLPAAIRVTHHQEKPRDITPETIRQAEEVVRRLRETAQPARVRAAEQRLAALRYRLLAGVRMVRLSDVKANFEAEPEAFRAEIPKDWAVRDLDAAPRPADRGGISPPVNPSTLVR